MAKTKKVPVSRAKTAYGLLSEVRRLILEEPLRYNQEDWLSRIEEHANLFKFPSCGTIGCVAGWVATLKRGRDFDWMGSLKIASEILGVSEEQAFELFNGGAARGQKQTRQHAESGAAHIARFQKKYHAQLIAKHV